VTGVQNTQDMDWLQNYGGVNRVALYFKGRVVSDERIVEQLGTDDPKVEHIGNRVWVWENMKTGKTLITGDEGNGWCVILAKCDSKKEAIAKLNAKRQKNEVFNELVQKIIKEYPNAT